MDRRDNNATVHFLETTQPMMALQTLSAATYIMLATFFVKRNS